MKKLLLLVMVICLLTPSVVRAQDNPNSTQIGDVGVFPDVIETGDQLWFVRYNIDYTTEPSEPAEELFHMAIYDTDGTTLLFTRPVTDYGNDTISIYLTLAQALTWDGGYMVRISGNPAIFDPLLEGVNMASRTLGAGDFYDNEALPGFIMEQGQILETLTSIDYVSSDGYITPTGAGYLNEGTPGLSQMAPSAFQYSTSTPELPDTFGNTTYQDVLAGNVSPSYNRMITSFSDFLGVGENWAGYLFVGFVGILIMLGVWLLFPNAGLLPAFLAGVLVIPMGAELGWISLSIWVLIGMGVLIVGAILFYMGKLST